MLKYALFLSFFVFTLATPAMAVDEMSLPEKPRFEGECRAKEAKIKDKILEANTCWDDLDCQLHHYGCPWQLGLCHFSVTGKDNKEERREIYDDINDFDDECMPEGSAMDKYCAQYDEALDLATCDDSIELFCVQGKCMTKTRILLQNAPGKGVDDYGSLRIYGDN